MSDIESLLSQEAAKIAKKSKPKREVPAADYLLSCGMIFVGTRIQVSSPKIAYRYADVLSHATVISAQSKVRIPTLNSCIAHSFFRRVGVDAVAPVLKLVGKRDKSPFPQWLGDIQATLQPKYRMCMPISSMCITRPSAHTHEAMMPTELKKRGFVDNIVSPTRTNITTVVDGMQRMLVNERDTLGRSTVMAIVRKNVPVYYNSPLIEEHPNHDSSSSSLGIRDVFRATSYVSRPRSRAEYYQEEHIIPVVETCLGHSTALADGAVRTIRPDGHRWNDDDMGPAFLFKSCVTKFKLNHKFTSTDGSIREVAPSVGTKCIDIEKLRKTISSYPSTTRIIGGIRPDMFTPHRVANYVPGLAIHLHSVISAVFNSKVKYGTMFHMTRYSMNDVEGFSRLTMNTMSQSEMRQIGRISDRMKAGIHQVIFLLFPKEAVNLMLSAEVGVGKTRTAFSRWLQMHKPKTLYVTTSRLVNEVMYDDKIRDELSSDILISKNAKERETNTRRWATSRRGKVLVVSKTEAGKILSSAVRIPLLIVDEADAIVRTDSSWMRDTIRSARARIGKVILMSGTHVYGNIDSADWISRRENSELISAQDSNLVSFCLDHVGGTTFRDGTTKVRVPNDERAYLSDSISLPGRKYTGIGRTVLYSTGNRRFHTRRDYGVPSAMFSIPVTPLPMEGETVHSFMVPYRTTCKYLSTASAYRLFTGTNETVGNAYRFRVMSNGKLSRRAVTQIMIRDKYGGIRYSSTSFSTWRPHVEIRASDVVNEPIGSTIRIYKEKMKLVSKFTHKAKKTSINITYTLSELIELLRDTGKHWDEVLAGAEVASKVLQNVVGNSKPALERIGTTDAIDETGSGVGTRLEKVNSRSSPFPSLAKYILGSEFEDAVRKVAIPVLSRNKNRFAVNKDTVDVHRYSSSLIVEMSHGRSGGRYRKADELGTPDKCWLTSLDEEIYIQGVRRTIPVTTTGEFVQGDIPIILLPPISPLTARGIRATIESAVQSAAKRNCLDDLDNRYIVLVSPSVTQDDIGIGEGSTTSYRVVGGVHPFVMATRVRQRRTKESKYRVGTLVDLTLETTLTVQMSILGFTDLSHMCRYAISSGKLRGNSLSSLFHLPSLYVNLVSDLVCNGTVRKDDEEVITQVCNELSKNQRFTQVLLSAVLPANSRSKMYAFQTEKSIVMNRIYDTVVMEENLGEGSRKRFNALISLIRSASNLPMIVFTKRPKVADYLTKELVKSDDVEKLGVKVVPIVSKTKTGTERRTIEEQGTDKMVIVTTTGVLQRGFNLGLAKSVVIYETMTSSSSVIQSIGRIERPDADKDIRAYIIRDNTPWSLAVSRTRGANSRRHVEESSRLIEEIEGLIDLEVGNNCLDILNKRGILLKAYGTILHAAFSARLSALRTANKYLTEDP